jgi:parallel beta-helix repeat protein
MRIRPFLAVLAVAAAVPGDGRTATFCVNTAAGLRSAIVTARTNGQTDLIQIVQGTYVVTGESGRFLHDANESVRFEGGYVAGCGSRVVNPANTILDGNLLFPPLEMYATVPVNHSVDGITARNGRSNGETNIGGLWSYTAGGTFLLTNSTLTGNVAAIDGGGLYLGEHASATIINNTISGNTAGFGGGVYSYRVRNLTLRGNTISNNVANFVPNGDGGGVYVDAGDPATKYVLTLTSNTFTSNTSNQTGGGMFVFTGFGGTATTFLVTDNVFTTNASGTGGALGMGGVFDFRAERNTFQSNTASLNGGALAVLTVDLVKVASNVFRNNTAAQNGGAFYFLEGALSPPRATNNVISLTNNTLVGNQATAAFGGAVWLRLHDDTDVGNIYNNIFSGNTAPGTGAAGDIAIDSNGNGNGVHSPVNLQDNDFNHAIAGFFSNNPGFVIPASNLNNANPLFVNAGAGNYRLQAGSPCRNTGNNSAPGLPGYDRDFAFRFAETTVDMGAYEFAALPFHRRHIIDFDGDLRADIATYHSGSGLWFVRSWRDDGTTTATYGGPGYEEVAGDYDGDARTDTAIYHPGSGFWFVRFSSTGTEFSMAFGGSGYAPVPDDYDGDGRTDLAVYHAASGTWFVRQSSTGTILTVGFGGTGYVPVQEDYDGDGLTDIAVFHPSSGLWFVRQTTTGTVLTVGYGGSGYTPVPRDYDGDGRADIAVYHASSGLWFIRQSMSLATQTIGFGGTGYVPVPGYYDPDGRADATVYQPSSGLWFVRQSQSGTTFTVGFGGAGYDPVE